MSMTCPCLTASRECIGAVPSQCSTKSPFVCSSGLLLMRSVVVVSRVDCQPLPWRFEWTAALLSQAAVHGSHSTARALTPSVGQVTRSPRQRLADRTRGPGPPRKPTPTHACKHDGPEDSACRSVRGEKRDSTIHQ